MFRNLARFTAAAVLAALFVIAAAPVRAEGPSLPAWNAGEAASSLVRQAWSWLAGLWSGQDTGRGIDPEDEDDSNAGATVQGDHGCTIDPNGRCTP